MITNGEGRWPPVYDADDLKRCIRDLVKAPNFSDRFFDTLQADPAVCQGDIIELAADFPHLDQEGEAAADAKGTVTWLVVGNTCDFFREEVTTSQVVPLTALGTEIPPDALGAFHRYEYARRFYVPTWPGDSAPQHRVAEFTHIVTIDKRAFTNRARIVARMSRPAWVLLHSCLIRFLARDDGRFDAAPAA